MKNLYSAAILLLIGMTLSLNCHAQTTIGFTYDDSGHRDTRSVITLKKASILDAEDVDQEDAIKNNIGLQEILIYPNPTKGLLRIDLPDFTEQEVIIRVFEPQGKLLIQESGVTAGIDVDLSDFASGFYILSIQIGQEKKEWKIIKE